MFSTKGQVYRTLSSKNLELLFKNYAHIALAEPLDAPHLSVYTCVPYIYFVPV